MTSPARPQAVTRHGQATTGSDRCSLAGTGHTPGVVLEAGVRLRRAPRATCSAPLSTHLNDLKDLVRTDEALLRFYQLQLAGPRLIGRFQEREH